MVARTRLIVTLYCTLSLFFQITCLSSYYLRLRCQAICTRPCTGEWVTTSRQNRKPCSNSVYSVLRSSGFGRTDSTTFKTELCLRYVLFVRTISWYTSSNCDPTVVMTSKYIATYYSCCSCKLKCLRTFSLFLVYSILGFTYLIISRTLREAKYCGCVSPVCLCSIGHVTYHLQLSP
jgi:hypothetical protein